jgi:endonuclease-8
MPEGDTIFRSARTLKAALAGRTVTAFESRFASLDRHVVDRPLSGQTVLDVRAVGKHLLMEFSGGLVLRTHMRMNGSWHLYRPGERWRRGRAALSILIATEAFVAVAFDVPVAEFIPASRLARHEPLSRLGPDLLAESFDADEAAARLAARPDEPIARALIDQSVMAGAGNVYKSEALFLAGLHPGRRVSTLSPQELRGLIDKLRALMVANVLSPGQGFGPVPFGGSRRTTRMANPGAGLWVYGRSGRPCRRCGTPIRYGKQGEEARGTYWCERCQR